MRVKLAKERLSLKKKCEKISVSLMPSMKQNQ